MLETNENSALTKIETGDCFMIHNFVLGSDVLYVVEKVSFTVEYGDNCPVINTVVTVREYVVKTKMTEYLTMSAGELIENYYNEYNADNEIR